MVTPEAPVKVLKNAQTSVAAMAVPPGSQPNQARNSRTRRRLAPLSASRYPASVNSGMVGSEGDATTR
jgi:hypothetical protein